MSFGKNKEGERLSFLFSGSSSAPTKADAPAGSYTPSSATFGTEPQNGKSSAGAYISKGSTVVGTLNFSGDAEVHGTVDGDLTCSGRLTIGETGSMKGKISAAEVIIAGQYDGEVTSTSAVRLKRTARATCTLLTPSVSIEEGAMFEGSCKMVARPATSSIASSIIVEKLINPILDNTSSAGLTAKAA